MDPSSFLRVAAVSTQRIAVFSAHICPKEQPPGATETMGWLCAHEHKYRCERLRKVIRLCPLLGVQLFFKTPEIQTTVALAGS